MTTSTSYSDRVCRLPEVETLTGIRASRIYELMASGQFPNNFKLTPGGRASGWLLSDIQGYLVERASNRNVAA